MEDHSIHRIHEFLPFMARQQPDLLSMLPDMERPTADASLSEWVMSLPQRRLVEICSAWVLETLRRLRESTPLTNVLLRGCLYLGGEFDLADAAAVAIGEEAPPGHPRREEIKQALLKAARVGLLIHIHREDRFCVPFPVRLSFEGVDYLGSMEREGLRIRMIQHFAQIAAEMTVEPDLATPRHWRFSNLLSGWEMATDMMEELLGLEPSSWIEQWENLGEVPEQISEPLRAYGRFLSKAMVARQSDGGLRLITASTAAVSHMGDVRETAQFRSYIGQYHLRRRQFPKAIEIYRGNQTIFESIGEDLGTVMAISAVALAHREMGNRDLAIAEFTRACRMARERQLPEPEIDTANCAVKLLIDEDRNFEAIQLLRDVETSQREGMRKSPALAELLVLLGMALRLEERLDEARDVLFSALDIARLFLHRPAEGRGALELGRLYAHEGAIEDALRWVRRARSLFAETSHYEGIAEATMTMFTINRQAGMETDGDDTLLKALRAAHAARNMTLVATVWRERAAIAVEHNDHAQAIGHVLQEIKALRHTQSVRLLADAHLRAGALYAHQQLWVPAATEILRTQALTRSHQIAEEPRQLMPLMAQVRRFLTDEQFDFLVQEVTEELESGILRSGRE